MKIRKHNLSNLGYFSEHKHLILFFLVGGINTLFGYSLYAFFIFIKLHYALASLLSTVAGVLFNFKTTGVIVFKNHDNRLLLKFIVVYGVIYAVNVGCLRIFSAHGTNLYLAGAILIIPVALLSFSLLKKFVFGGEKSEVNQRSNPLFQRGR